MADIERTPEVLSAAAVNRHPFSGLHVDTACEAVECCHETTSQAGSGGEVDVVRYPHQIRGSVGKCYFLSERAPRTEPGLILVLAYVGVPLITFSARAAPAGERNRHSIADAPTEKVVTDFGNNPGHFVPWYVGIGDGGVVAHPRVPVRPADTIGFDIYHNTIRRGDRIGHRLDCE